MATPQLIVFAPVVGSELGNAFEQAGVNFVDAIGNCYVRLGSRNVARIQGRRGPTRRPAGKALRAPAYRALLTLLIRPELIDTSSRTIAARAEVSPQTANDLRKYLVSQGLVLETRIRRHWDPARKRDAITLLLSGFSTLVSPKLFVGRFRAGERDPLELEERIQPVLDAACEWRYGGGVAAQRLMGYYRGDQTLLYLQQPPANLPAQLRFVPDESGAIVLAGAPSPLAFQSPDPRCVHPLVVYADLIGEGHNRAREAAAELYERFIAVKPDA